MAARVNCPPEFCRARGSSVNTEESAMQDPVVKKMVLRGTGYAKQPERRGAFVASGRIMIHGSWFKNSSYGKILLAYCKNAVSGWVCSLEVSFWRQGDLPAGETKSKAVECDRINLEEY